MGHYDCREAGRRKDRLCGMASLFDQTLVCGQRMFEQATAAYWGGCSAPDMQDDMRTRNKRVNELARSIRRAVACHLSARPSQDVISCLILMAVSRDAEQIAECSERLLDVRADFEGEYQIPYYAEPLREISQSVTDLFDLTRRAFNDGDTTAGRQARATSTAVDSRCDFLVGLMLRQADALATGEVVSYGLMCRHLAQVAACLGSIAISTDMSLESFGFQDDRNGHAGAW